MSTYRRMTNAELKAHYHQLLHLDATGLGGECPQADLTDEIEATEEEIERRRL